jgi:hypothetical protein
VALYEAAKEKNVLVMVEVRWAMGYHGVDVEAAALAG